MKKFVHKYLDSFFDVKRVDSKNNKISLFEFDSIVIKENGSFIYGDRLVKELIEVAYLDAITLKKWVAEWAIIKSPYINLEYYWSQEEPWLPQIQQVAARTIANDLVAVQPMESPKGLLCYLDYKYYDDRKPNQNGRTYNQEVLRANIQQLIENQQRAMGALDHPDPPMAFSMAIKKDLDNPK